MTNGTWSRLDFDLALSQGPQVKELELAIENPRLWQPWERGFPHLYEVQVDIYPSFPSAPSVPSDSLVTTFGLRAIELAPNDGAPPDAPPWIFVLNGQPLFIRGANWVPADALPGRVRREDYAQLLGLAKEAGINMLRVWGGGLREKRAFYELCDELGLLIWQEFPFACVFFGYFPRHESFLSLAREECTAMVRQLRNHPSLVLWCGGNEYSPRRNRTLIETLRAVVAADDGTRPFKDVSPDRGDSHNWRVWHGKAPVGHYRRDEAQFASEFGLSAVPDLASLQQFIPAEHLWPPGESWQYHHAELVKLCRYAGPWLRDCAGLTSAPAGAASLDQFIEATQKAQAFGLQVAIEHFRRRKYRASGTLFWQFNEPWPALCWSVVDYGRRPKLAYHKLRQIYNPVLISLDYPLIEYRPGTVLRAEVWAINDLLQSFEDCWLQILLDDKEIFSRTIDLPPDSCRPVGLIEHPLPDGGQHPTGCLKIHRVLSLRGVERRGNLFEGLRLLRFARNDTSMAQAQRPGLPFLRHTLTAELSCQGRVISANSYDLQYHDPAEAGFLDRLRSWIGEMAVR